MSPPPPLTPDILSEAIQNVFGTQGLSEFAMPPKKKKNNNKTSSSSSMETSPAKQAKKEDDSKKEEANTTGANDSHGSGYQTPNEDNGGQYEQGANDTIIDPPETDDEFGPPDSNGKQKQKKNYITNCIIQVYKPTSIPQSTSHPQSSFTQGTQPPFYTSPAKYSITTTYLFSSTYLCSYHKLRLLFQTSPETQTHRSN